MTMTYSTITAKGQVTLPAELRRKLGLRPGARVAIREVQGTVVIDPPPDMTTVRARARAEMEAANTWGTVIESGAWAGEAAQKVTRGQS
ncbi:MAG: AbrB/MazE/SpoVT family DNA-binding domain-containing protein [Propionibacteriaceae bacterium]|jgi:AbrB family looped-hinge helix DNA binding protein|nr:AbrB/MazE/SpoVT family DNA-binding domain-containing protein [Propionibacteriaceae bacterium]